MFAYFLIGVPFIATVVILDSWVLNTRVVLNKRTWLIGVIMLVLTAGADQLLTGLPIVQYNPRHISGVRVGLAPIEDFGYTIASVIGLGALYTHGNKAAQPKRRSS